MPESDIEKVLLTVDMLHAAADRAENSFDRDELHAAAVIILLSPSLQETEKDIEYIMRWLERLSEKV